ncbi:MAG: hypothetical protein C4560_10770 [Nitrospiraceae bacterium]|nr:MAG: hypothetical protein C4560_10770 [Nitrospiraceae bacterium]
MGDSQIGSSRSLILSQTLKHALLRVDSEKAISADTIITDTGTIPGDCPVSPGSATWNESYDDITGNFFGTINFNGYCSEGVTISGNTSYSGKVDVDTGEILQLSISYNSLIAVSGSDSFTSSGNISFNFGVTPMTVTLNLLLQDNRTLKICKLENYVMALTEGYYYVDINIVSGLFYNPDYGYVSVSTPTPLRIYDGDNWPSQGILVSTGKTGIGGDDTKARLTALSATQYKVEADTDGDRAYDDYYSGPLNWDDGVYDWDDGIYGIDFTASSFNQTVLYAADAEMFDQTGELTVEAWVKRKTSGTLNGSIIARYNPGGAGTTNGGLLLLVDTNQPKFMVQTTRFTSTLSSAASGAALAVDTWTHIAGVVVNEDHSAVHAECAGGLATGRAETPHIDIYINGVYANCATTNSLFATNDAVSGDTSEHRLWIGMLPSLPTLIFNTSTTCYTPTNCFDATLQTTASATTKFEGVIDEVRFWTVARSQAEIQECMNQELGLTGACKVDNTKLKVYYRMDEGSGHTVTDLSGSGLSGSLMDYNNNSETDWPGAWVAGRL